MRDKESIGFVSGCVRHKRLIWLMIWIFVAIGIYGLVHMKKDEFPAFTIRQGLVVGVYPGATVEEVEQQLTTPLEQLLFSMPEIDRQNTYSITKDGMSYVYVSLVMAVKDRDLAWSKIRHKLNESKSTQFPPGVLALMVLDDFGNTSSILIAMEADDKSHRELLQYTDELKNKLRHIPEMGNVRVLGGQEEEVSVTIDYDKLASYGISPQTLLLSCASQGLITMSGTMKDSQMEIPLHVENTISSEKEIEELVVFADPQGNTIKLSDVATVERRLAPQSKYVNFNGSEALIISVEMRKGYDIVAFGHKVEEILHEFQHTLPPSVNISRITNQPKVVQKSVTSFLRDLVISMVVVIAVMLMLFPFRTALIASSSLPICTAITIAVMYLFGIELNTVTLAALIVVLGMIVDDSIINIDGFIDKRQLGLSPHEAAIKGAKELFMPMFIATAAISTMFFPIKYTITGPLGDFVQLFPITIATSLMISLVYAMMAIPAMEIKYIKTDTSRDNGFSRAQHRFFAFLQHCYDTMQGHCFKHPFITIGLGVTSILLGIAMFFALNVQMMPTAERDSFAIEIRLPEGHSITQTLKVSDSLQKILRNDPRVVSVTEFIGEAAPRFHVTYAPHIPASNLAQLIVSTKSSKDTEGLLSEMDEQYSHYFPEAYVRFRQLDYQAVANPIEVFVYGDDYQAMSEVSERIRDYMSSLDEELRWVHSDYDEFINTSRIVMKSDECSMLGISKGMLSLSLASNLGGQPLTTLWDGNSKIPVRLYSSNLDDEQVAERLSNQLVPTATPGVYVPLRQVADVMPEWSPAQIVHRNGKNVITVSADMKFWEPQTQSMKKVKNYIDTEILPTLPDNIHIEYGGLSSLNDSVIPEIILSVAVMVMILFAFLAFYFKKISIALLTLGSSSLCLFGAFFGEWIFGLDFGMTSVLGIVSLIGIIVRNGIIMYEYAETLRSEGNSTKEAAMQAGSRRMRPIFLTSTTAALGVLPMIISRNPLWMPMGVVICFGVLLSQIIVLAVMPVLYWQIFKKKEESDLTPKVNHQ